MGVPVAAVAPAPFLAAATAALLTRTFVFTEVNEVSMATGGLVVVLLGDCAEACGLTEFDEVVDAGEVVVVIGVF